MRAVLSSPRRNFAPQVRHGTIYFAGSLAYRCGAASQPKVQKLRMIRHVVFFTAADKKDVGRIVEGLSSLRTIPHSSHFEVGRNLNRDALSDAVDVVVYAEFEDAAALAAYKAHPVYQACITIVRPLREMRVAADLSAVT